ncbi:hypothetical protein C8R47DRAFT_1205128 [Mycena vitilis]|nr:hypothetical protein C8R47DRAFT_1205128 [Mycena vitilis]
MRAQFTLPRRGRFHELEVDMVDLLIEEYYIAADLRNQRFNEALDSDDDAPMPSVSSGSPLSSQYSSDSVSSYVPSDGEVAMSDDSPDVVTTDHSASGASSVSSTWSESGDESEGELPVLELTAVPDSFSRAHLQLLEFRFIKWNDQPGPLLDFRRRVALMYIGCPVETLQWQRCVIEASHLMLDAWDHLHKSGFDTETISDGIQCTGPAGRRPQRMRGHRSISAQDVVLAQLRESDAIQTIISFQNDVLRKTAPRAWKSASTIIQTVLDHNVGLHVPLSTEPTAFSRVDYRFSPGGRPIREESYIPSMTALTSVGNYDGSDEGEVVVWPDKTVINFPVGATILIPSCLPYSFTAVQSPGYQMVVAQTCEQALGQFVANGLTPDDALVDQSLRVTPVRKREAVAAAAMYGTLEELDEEYDPPFPTSMDRVPGRAISNTARPVGATPNNPLLVDENGHFGLTASTIDNPFLVDENGHFVRSLSERWARSPVKKSPSDRSLQIYEGPRSTVRKDAPHVPVLGRFRGAGPPSAIRQDIPRIRVARQEAQDRPYIRALARVSQPPMLASAPTVGSSASAPAARSTASASASAPSARSGASSSGAASGSGKAKRKIMKDVLLTRSAGAHPLRLRPTRVSRIGFRVARATPLTVDDLYLTDARPPADSNARPEHECSVCFNIKSHPVIYGCGHSHCYVCVRRWLEQQWTCPSCRTPMKEAPLVHEAAIRAIALDHSDWHDPSLVSYSWDGLRFPQPIETP